MARHNVESVWNTALDEVLGKARLPAGGDRRAAQGT